MNIGASDAYLSAADVAKDLGLEKSISMIDGPAAQGYPIVNYEYAIVNTKQANSTNAEAVRQFLTWASNPADGSSPRFLGKVGFRPLPAAIQFLSDNQIDKISG